MAQGTREKARWKEAFTQIENGSAESVKRTFDGWRHDNLFTLTTDNKGDLLKAAIDRQDAGIFREVLIYADDPNATITYSLMRGDTRYNYSYSPIAYAIQVKGTHDISLSLANNPRVSVSDELLDGAKKSGMQDVAAVVAKRIAELRREEARQLDQEAAHTAEPQPEQAAAPAASAEAAPAGEIWALMSEKSVAHVTSSPVIGRKLTEIFNFENRERVLITENLKTGKESIGDGVSFDKLGADTVRRAEDMLKKLTAENAKKTFNL